MSDHVHISVMTDDPMQFVRNLKCRYTSYFNNKYHRKGKLGDSGAYVLKLDGSRHILAAWSYILRNGLHHGLCELAYEYPYSTVSHLFNREFGRKRPSNLMKSRKEINRFLPRFSEFPDSYEMDGDGMFTRESITKISQVEMLYSTPRAFVYFMNRLSSEEWLKEQLKDENGKEPVSMAMIESCVRDMQPSQLEANEYGKVDRGHLSDEALCGIIDERMVPLLRKDSVYQLDDSEKNTVAMLLMGEYHVSKKQVNRCLFFGKAESKV
jgi:hypothetical protein